MTARTPKPKTAPKKSVPVESRQIKLGGRSSSPGERESIGYASKFAPAVAAIDFWKFRFPVTVVDEIPDRPWNQWL